MQVRITLANLFFICSLIIVLSLFFLAGYSIASPHHKIEKLRCEYKTNPLGLDDESPRLSWIMQSEKRGQSQSAYHVVVSTTAEKLAKNDGDLWDSGKVLSDRSIQVKYQGKPLQSRMDCFWKVRTWDQNNIVSHWSPSARWSMGLLNEKDWKARWVSFDTSKEIADPWLHLPPSPHFRKKFTSSNKIKKATLYASALGLYEVFLNDKRIGKNYFTPGWSNYDKRVFYNSYDVTEHIEIGDNVLGAVLANGWYAGYIGFVPPHLRPMENRAFYGEVPGLLLQLELTYYDGSRKTIVTDPTWRTSTGPIRSSDMQMGEVYDAQLEITGWSNSGFDDIAWEKVQVLNVSDDVILQSYPGNPVRKQQTLEPVEITEPKKNVYVFNFAQNFAGWVRLKVNGPKGSTIKLRFAEMLNEDGTVMTANLRGARSTDIYTLKGDTGYEEWEPSFTYHGFQYVEMTGHTGKPDLSTLTASVLHSSDPIAGSFISSDSLVNKLYNNIFWTQRSNFFDIPTDCPQRDERLGWSGDAQIFMKSALYNMELGAFFKKWLINLFDDQRPSGAFPDFAPSPFILFEPSPGWMDAGIICPYELYRAYEDTDIINMYYGAMEKFMDYLNKNNSGYIRKPSGNNWGDWQSIDSHTPNDVIATAYYAYDAKLMSEMAQAIGKNDDSVRYHKLFNNIKKAFDTSFVDERGRIKGDSQTAYAMALYMGLLEPQKKDGAGKRLKELIKKRNYHLSTGFLGIKHLLPALSDIGSSEIAYKLLLQTSYPSWGYPIMNGATTVWERWNSYTYTNGFANPGMNSFNHYAFGSVLEWLYSYLAGIDAVTPGYKKFLVRPQIGDLSIKNISASYDSIYGLIESNWQVDNSKNLKLKVQIPPNTSAEIHLPAINVSTITESGKLLKDVDGVSVKSIEKDTVILEVHSGIYDFSSKFSH